MIGKHYDEVGVANNHMVHLHVLPKCGWSRPHYHKVTEETYYIISGQARMIGQGQAQKCDDNADKWNAKQNPSSTMRPRGHGQNDNRDSWVQYAIRPDPRSRVALQRRMPMDVGPQQV